MEGRISAAFPKRREISVTKQREYNQLPFATYPTTHLIKPGGKRVTLINGNLNCDVAFHRYEKGDFYIGTARRILGPVYTKKFYNFLEAVGIMEVGTLVELKFEGSKIYVSQI